jgi:V/A-type H+-transporting ATPase subunit I
VAVGAFYLHLLWVTIAGAALIAVGLAAAGIGLFAAAGGGASGATQAAVELFDMTIRLGSNLVSFARLAAFGLTHAALGGVIWSATSAMWGHGAVRTAGAVVVFTVGNALAFALEALIAGVQALRLEYYELFSRVFDVEGRPYRPWHVPLARTEEPCRPG